MALEKAAPQVSSQKAGRYIYIYMYLHICMYLYVCMYMYVYNYIYVYMYMYVYIYIYYMYVCIYIYIDGLVFRVPTPRHILSVCATKTFHFARISWTQMCLKVFYRLHLVAESALGTRQAELLLKSVEEDGAKAKVVGRPKAGVGRDSVEWLWGVYMKINRYRLVNMNTCMDKNWFKLCT